MVDTLHQSFTRQVLIEATAQRLWLVDECELRILDICQETNLSTSVIYGHFRSRQGLIDASLLHLFSIVTEEFIGIVEGAIAGPHPTGSFVDTLYALPIDPAQETAITRQRQMFFRVSATALSRPSIRPGFLAIYGAFMRRFEDLLDGLVDRGLLGAELSGHQWAIFFEGQLLSRAFHDLSADWDLQRDWSTAAHHLLAATRTQSIS